MICFIRHWIARLFLFCGWLPPGWRLGPGNARRGVLELRSRRGAVIKWRYGRWRLVSTEGLVIMRGGDDWAEPDPLLIVAGYEARL